MDRLLQEIISDCRPYTKDGQVASYIPELSLAERDALGIHVLTMDGKEFSAGESNVKFTIQSISKVIIFICCLLDSTEENITKKVSLEPTSDGFNSIINLETKNANKPLNPFINSGAIACITLLNGSTYEEKFNRILNFTRKICENDEICINQDVYMSEKTTGSRNRALAYYMASTKIIEGDVEGILDVYFKACSLMITCRDLAKLALVLADDGVIPGTTEVLFSKKIAKTVKAIMVLCGMYNESGSFSVKVGMPSKSGVGGGILSVSPKKMGIGVFGPSLNKNGTSIASLKVLEALSRKLELSIF